jgi:tetratricopeptide (TPR) repeat protein
MPKKPSTTRKLSRQDQRDLDIEITFLEGLIRRDPGYVDALRILGDDYTRRGRIPEGLHIDQRLASLCPADPCVHYNLACSYSLTEQYDLAVAELDRAINLGYRDFRWMVRDPDLRNLRKHPLFKNIRNKLRTLARPNR